MMMIQDQLDLSVTLMVQVLQPALSQSAVAALLLTEQAQP